MSDRKQLEDLRDRLKAATGPDPELDARLHAALVLIGPVTVVGPPAYYPPRFFCLPAQLSGMDWIGYDLLNMAGAYTGNTEHAVSLLPDVAWYRMGSNWKAATAAFCAVGFGEVEVTAATIPLALCLARVEYELAKTEAADGR